METISTKILEKGISASDLNLIRAWGYFLGLDDNTITNRNNNFYAEQIEFLMMYNPDTRNHREKLSTSQLRKFFGAVKKIQSSDFEKSKSEIELLIPKIAYSVGRDIKKDQGGNLRYRSKIKDFYDLLYPILIEIKNDKNKFKNFVNILEALVAYHKEVSAENN